MAEKQSPEKETRRGILDIFRKVRDIVSLTRQEQALVVCILLSICAGAVIQHCRRVYHLTHLVALPAPTPSLRAKDLYVVPTNTRSAREPSDDDR
jgi:hypothetical protein